MKSKVYEYLNKYLGEYLYGFEKEQLEVALLAGSVNLSNVNLRPDKVNRLLQHLGFPFHLKAGLIGRLSFKVHLASWLSNPLEIDIDELLVVLSPVINEQPYDFGQLRSPESDEELPENLFDFPDELPNGDSEHAPSQKTIFERYFSNTIRNLTLKARKLVVRYEDETFGFNHPYAFGFSLDSLQIKNSSREWCLSEQLEQERVKSERHAVVKECIVQKLFVFVASMSSMHVPTSLYEETLHSPIGIFEAIAAYEVRDMILEDAEAMARDPSKLLVSPVNAQCCVVFQEDGSSKFSMLLEPFTFRLSAAMAECLRNFQEYFINSKLWWILCYYRPKFNIPLLEHCKRSKQRKFRRKVIRQWFKYAFKFIKARKQLRKYIQVRRERLRAKGINEELNKIQELMLRPKKRPADSLLARNAKRATPGQKILSLAGLNREKPEELPPEPSHFPKWLRHTQITVASPVACASFFDEDTAIECELSVTDLFFQAKATAAEFSMSTELTQAFVEVKDSERTIETLKSGRRAKFELQTVNEGFFKKTQKKVLMREAQKALVVHCVYRPEEYKLDREEVQNMYDFSVTLGSLHLKYSTLATQNLFILYESFKLDKAFKANMDKQLLLIESHSNHPSRSNKHVPWRETRKRALLHFLIDTMTAALSNLHVWFQYKDLHLKMVDYLLHVSSKGARVKLEESNNHYYSVAFPKGDFYLGKQNGTTLLQLWGFRVKTTDSLSGLFHFVAAQNEALSDRVHYINHVLLKLKKF